MSKDIVTYDVIDRVAVITMNRGPVNAVDLPMIDAIHAALKRADADPEVRAMVLTSAVPGIFCGGMDLAMIRGGDAQRMRGFLNRFYLDTLDLQHNFSKPTIAAINGAARGAGMTLSITCDMIVAEESASLGYPEINVGVLPAIHFAHLPAVVGRHRAFELLLLGDSFTPAEAKEMGLVNHVVPDGTALEKALDLGRRFAAKSPTALAIGRRAFQRSVDNDYRRNVANQVEMMCALVGTPDAQEGLDAFAEKRKPVWQKPA